jgi:hypothetical protein
MMYPYTVYDVKEIVSSKIEECKNGVFILELTIKTDKGTTSIGFTSLSKDALKIKMPLES